MHEKEVQTSPQEGPGAPSARLLALYVNDSTDDQVLFQAAVKKARVPMEIHVAETANGGISYLKSLLKFSQKHEPRWVDIVILDLLLPDDSGLAVLKYIRQNPGLQRLPVVILTGHSDPAMHKQAYDLGANALHVKPTSFKDSTDLVATLYSHWSNARRPVA